jgi:S-adenosylmethionine synthetase
MDNGFVGASTQGSQKAGGAPASNLPSEAKKNYIVQNYDSTDSEIYVVVATNIGSQSTNVGVGWQWREIY